MRIQGRQLRPSNLAERRILKTLGVDALRVPRKYNPFAVARHIRKLAAGTGGGLPELRAMLAVRAAMTNAPVIAVASADVPNKPAAPTLPDSSSEPREAHAA